MTAPRSRHEAPETLGQLLAADPLCRRASLWIVNAAGDARGRASITAAGRAALAAALADDLRPKDLVLLETPITLED